MITTSSFKVGLNIKIENEMYTIVDFQHIKRGRGGAIDRVKLKNIKTGSIIERTFDSGEKVEDISLEERKMQYLYKDGEQYFFMDTETFEQISIDEKNIKDAKKFLKENLIVQILSYQGDIFGIKLPIFVELEVIETEKGLKGDTVSSVNKPAKLETGAVINVPLFIENGDILKIDTRDGKYVERVK